MLATWQDPVVVKYFGGVPSTPEECWARLLRYAGLWRLLGFGYWRIRERATGRFVGEVGLAEFRRDIVPNVMGWPEAGWVLAPWAHGRGFAREAAEAIFAWADAALEVKLHGLQGSTPDNAFPSPWPRSSASRPSPTPATKGRPVVLLERQPT